MAERRCELESCGRPVKGRADARYCSASCRAAAAKIRRQTRSKAQRGAATPAHALAGALTRAIRKTSKTPADGAAVALARLYARAIDADPAALEKLGPQLLSVLTALGMTPKARPGTVGGGSAEISPARLALDELRARRVR